VSYRYGASYLDPGLNTLVAPTLQYNLFGWGNNNSGQLCLGNITSYSSPKQIGNLTTWSVLSGSGTSFFGIQSNGTLWACGQNYAGVLGLGNTTFYSSPKQVGALTNWAKICVSNVTVWAVKTDGTLWSWGANQYGQLGLSNTTYFSSPKQVGSLTNWLQVVASSYNGALAVKTDGTLWAWGQNNQGQLGQNNTTNLSSPKQVGSLTNWLTVAGGGYYGQSYAIKTDGTLWSWGNNDFGQLGLGNRTKYSSPKQVGSLTNWSKISSGNFSIVALKTDSTLWSWGYNAAGQLGVGNITSYSSPQQVGSLTNWLTISAGGYEAVSAIKTDGTLWAWGNNAYGQLGLGNTTYYSSPKQVGSSTTWKFAVCSWYDVYAIG